MMLLGRMLVMGLLVAPMTGCAHENDARDAAEAARLTACPDITESEAFALDPPPDADRVAAIIGTMCDGEISEAESRCLRSPFFRTSDSVAADQYAASPEQALRAAAGPETVITSFRWRNADGAEVAVELEGDSGTYRIEHTPRGWLVVSGDGCASGVAAEPQSPECLEAMVKFLERTPRSEGAVVSILCVDDDDSGTQDSGSGE
jgi:hypothetical protein